MGDASEKKAAFVVAIYAYEKQHPDELSFQQGDKIKVLEKHQTGWWTGEIKGEDGQMIIGNFPSNFVRQEEVTESSAPAESSPEPAKQGQGFAAGANEDQDNWKSAFTSTFRYRRLRMMLRGTQLISVIVSFGSGADQESYTEQNEFRALVGIGVLVFLYIIVIINCYIFNVEGKWKSFFCVSENPFNLTEAVFDTTFSVMLLAALIAALDKAQSLDNTSKAKVAGVFAFITFLLLVASAIVSWRLFKEPQKRQGAVELA